MGPHIKATSNSCFTITYAPLGKSAHDHLRPMPFLLLFLRHEMNAWTSGLYGLGWHGSDELSELVLRYRAATCADSDSRLSMTTPRSRAVSETMIRVDARLVYFKRSPRSQVFWLSEVALFTSHHSLSRLFVYTLQQRLTIKVPISFCSHNNIISMHAKCKLTQATFLITITAKSHNHTAYTVQKVQWLTNHFCRQRRGSHGAKAAVAHTKFRPMAPR